MRLTERHHIMQALILTIVCISLSLSIKADLYTLLKHLQGQLSFANVGKRLFETATDNDFLLSHSSAKKKKKKVNIKHSQGRF